ncbi:MAG: hypothetical protein KDD55_12305, partial [Bdellovibrionales bacterium]|nr:hypothetical protein [Bdellovibrionales bacterium]
MVSLDTASAGKEPLTAEAHQPRATNEPDKHQPIDTSRPVSRVLPIAERFMRKRLLQIASSPFNHDKKEAFTNVELRTDELIDVLALSSREERLGFVKDILDLAFQRKDAAIFFAKKAYNILGHTSHEEQQRIVDHIYAQSGSRDLKASLLHILLNNPRNLKDFQRLCAYAVPKRAKKLGCVHILEVFADAELSPARRAVDFTRRCGKTASLSLVKKRLVEIRDGIDELIQVVKNSPYKETEVAAATLRIAQRAKREVVAELQSNAKLSTKIDRYNLIAQRLDFELKYNYALTNTNGKKAATWDLKEIEAVREVFRGIENKFGSWILRLMPIHEIKRVGELPTKAGYTHQAYMDEYGLMEVSDAARWDDSESKTGDNIPRFKHKIAHEAGHALQYPYSYEWANRSGSRTGLLRLYPVQNIEFLPWMTAAWDEHVQLSDWVKLQQDRYKVRPHKTKDGLVITIDGED